MDAEVGQNIQCNTTTEEGDEDQFENQFDMGNKMNKISLNPKNKKMKMLGCTGMTPHIQVQTQIGRMCKRGVFCN